MFGNVASSPSLMTVLACLIKGINRVKDMQKVLGESQSLISNKLMYLREKGLVTKNKWVYELDWDKLIDLFYDAMRKELSRYTNVTITLVGDKNKKMKLYNVEISKEDLKKYIPAELVKKILSGYSTFLLVTGINLGSLEDIISRYLKELVLRSDKELRKYDKIYNSKLVEFKKVVKVILFELTPVFDMVMDKEIEEKVWNRFWIE